MIESVPRFELLNKQLVEADSHLFSATNRAFQYGDGVFETMKVAEGNINFYSDHYLRLTNAMHLLKLSFTEDFDRDHLHDSIQYLLSKNQLSSARVRLTVFREGTGFYLPEKHNASWHMLCSPLNTSIPAKGLSLGLYEEVHKAPGKFSNLKTLNALPYVLASIYASEHGFDDVFILNTSRKVIESVNCNIFVVSGSSVFTPPLSDGCLDGVMRKNIIRKAHENGVVIIEKSLDVSDVSNADEILLTNVIRGVQWVKTFNNKPYTSNRAQVIASWFR